MNTQKFSLSLAATVGIFFIGCTIFSQVAPALYTQVFESWYHMFGFLLQWPTTITLIMFPILVVTYTRLALREEAEVRSAMPTEYGAYAKRVPRFFPKFSAGNHNMEAKAK